MEVALAAVKLAHEAAGGADDDEEEIPEVASGRAARPRPRRPRSARPGGTGAAAA